MIRVCRRDSRPTARRIGVHMTRADTLFKRLKAARLDNTVEAEIRRLKSVKPVAGYMDCVGA